MSGTFTWQPHGLEVKSSCLHVRYIHMTAIWSSSTQVMFIHQAHSCSSHMVLKYTGYVYMSGTLMWQPHSLEVKSSCLYVTYIHVTATWSSSTQVMFTCQAHACGSHMVLKYTSHDYVSGTFVWQPHGLQVHRSWLHIRYIHVTATLSFKYTGHVYMSGTFMTTTQSWST